MRADATRNQAATAGRVITAAVFVGKRLRILQSRLYPSHLRKFGRQDRKTVPFRHPLLKLSAGLAIGLFFVSALV
jgi:hypothetical protein